MLGHKVSSHFYMWSTISRALTVSINHQLVRSTNNNNKEKRTETHSNSVCKRCSQKLKLAINLQCETMKIQYHVYSQFQDWEKGRGRGHIDSSHHAPSPRQKRLIWLLYDRAFPGHRHALCLWSPLWWEWRCWSVVAFLETLLHSSADFLFPLILPLHWG